MHKIPLLTEEPLHSPALDLYEASDIKCPYIPNDPDSSEPGSFGKREEKGGINDKALVVSLIS